jgi:hypothetical protein
MLSYEKQVFSQHGEDGIIEFLLNFVSNDKSFLEIGWGRGNQNCCKNLAVNHSFKGTGIDARRQKFFVENVDVKVKYITLDDVEYIISLEGLTPTVFSLDIDSFDWHILKQLIINNFRPKIICHEYNARLGPDKIIIREYSNTTVYDKKINYGASLEAYKIILEPYYNFITVDSSGVNAFWLRKDFNIPNSYDSYQFKENKAGPYTQLDSSWIYYDK